MDVLQHHRMKVALIPARAGSKGIPNKNIRELNGKPLIAYSIATALESKEFDEVIVSTDSPKIASIAKMYGASIPGLRPKELSEDRSTALDLIIYILEKIPSISDVMYLQPTSPLRTTEHIKEAFEIRRHNQCECVVSVSRAKKPKSWYVSKDENNKIVMPFREIDKNRQEASKEYVFNGSIYLSTSEYIKKVNGFLGPGTCLMEMSAKESIDIDDELDWILSEYLMKQREG